MNWRLYTDATATAAAYEAALARIFGTGADEARDDRARNGERPSHPLHPFYAAKTKATGRWLASNYSASRPERSPAKLPWSSFL